MTAGACALLVLVLSALVAVGATMRWDVALSSSAVHAAQAHPGITRVGQVLETVTQPPWLYAVCLLVVLVARLRGRLRAGRRASCALTAMVIASIASPLTKTAFGRARPAVEAGFTSATGGSYPSGHALASATVVLIVLVVISHGPWWGWLLGAGFLLVLGVDRVWLGAHWPSDVLAGWLIAGLIVFGVLTAWRPFSEHDGDEGRPAGGRLPDPADR